MGKVILKKDPHRMQRLARIISGNFGVKVKVEGDLARTDGKTIYLPNIECGTEEDFEELYGINCHEVLHVKHSKFDLKFDSNKEFMITNAIEDARVEIKGEKQFKGLKKIFKELNIKLKAKYFDKTVEKIEDPKDKLFIKFAGAVLNIFHGFKTMEDQEEDVKRILNMVKDLMKRMPGNTEGAHTIAKEMLKRLSTDMKGHSEKKKESEAAAGDEGRAIDGKRKAKEEADVACEKARKDLEKSIKSDPDKMSKEDLDEMDGEAAKKVKSYRMKKGERMKANFDLSKSEKELEKLQDEISALDEIMEMDESDLEDIKDSASQLLEWDKIKEYMERYKKEVEEKVKELIEKDAKDENLKDKLKEELGEGKSEKYIPFGTEKDLVKVIKNGSRQRYAELKVEVMEVVAPVFKYLSEKLKADIKRKDIRYKEYGRLDTKGFVRAAQGQTNIFKRKVTKKGYRTAVSLIVDCSGSMGSKAREAAKTAIAFGEALNRLNIPLEVIGFNAKHGKKSKGDDGWEKGRGSGTKLNFEIFKEFHSNNLVNIEKLQMAARGDDIFGESLMWGAERLAKRLEDRKIIFFMCDGQPACRGISSEVLARDLIVKVKQIEGAGIDVVGIGIMAADMTKFFDNSFQIEDTSELPEKLTEKLKERLVKMIGTK